MKLLFGAALAAFLVLAQPLHAADDDKARYRQNGYGLLYKLCEQEQPLDLILIVKTTPKEVGDFLHQVSAAAKQDVNALDELQGHDKALTFAYRGLPQFEEDTRNSIRDDKQHMLLFVDTGSAFTRAILVTQIEAGTYGMNLAKVLAGAEPNAHRAAVVRQIGERWEKLRNRAYALLNAT